jgi:hypothetical protein
MPDGQLLVDGTAAVLGREVPHTGRADEVEKMVSMERRT